MSALVLDEHGDLPLPVPIPVAKFFVRMGQVMKLGGAIGALALIPMGHAGWLELSMFLFGYVVTMLGITAGFHRLFSHRAFEATPPLRAFLAIAGTMAGQGPTTFWVGLHRKHHHFTDRDGDPHSPHHPQHGEGWRGRLRDVWHAHSGWFCDLKIQGWGRYVPDLLADPFMLSLHKHTDLVVNAGLLLPALVGGLVHQSWMGALAGLLWGGYLRMFVVEQLTLAVNSWAHLSGKRPFQTRDQSGNVAFLGLFALGEGWHNNHHAFPSGARAGLLPGQIDLSHLAIRTWVAMGLASKPQEVTPEQMAAKRLAVPTEAAPSS